MAKLIFVNQGEQHIQVSVVADQMCDSWAALGTEVLGIGELSKDWHKVGEEYGLTDSLNEADWTLLGRIWREAGLPPFQFGQLADWDRYRQAFDTSPDKPSWAIGSSWFYLGRKRHAVDHLLRLMKTDEQLVAYSAPGRIASALESDSLLRVSDARRWLARWGFDVVDSTSRGGLREIADTLEEPTPVVTSGMKDGKSKQGKSDVPARLRIQEAAAEIWISWLARDANPTVHGISDELARWCSDNSVTTKGGICPKAGTLRNTVIGAGHWTPPTLSRAQAKAHVAQLAQPSAVQVARDDR